MAIDVFGNDSGVNQQNNLTMYYNASINKKMFHYEKRLKTGIIRYRHNIIKINLVKL